MRRYQKEAENSACSQRRSTISLCVNCGSAFLGTHWHHLVQPRLTIGLTTQASPGRPTTMTSSVHASVMEGAVLVHCTKTIPHDKSDETVEVTVKLPEFIGELLVHVKDREIVLGHMALLQQQARYAER